MATRANAGSAVVSFSVIAIELSETFLETILASGTVIKDSEYEEKDMDTIFGKSATLSNNFDYKLFLKFRVVKAF